MEDKKIGFSLDDSPWIQMDKCDWSMFRNECVSTRYPKGHVFYFQDEYSDFVYIVNSGRVGMCLCTYEGNIRVATVLASGCAFGTHSLIDGRPHTCMAKVVSSEAYVTAVPKALFKLEMAENPKIQENLLVQAVHMNRMLLSHVAIMSFERSENRVCMVLLWLANQFSKEEGAEHILQVPFTQQDVAEITGLSRVCVANILSELKKDGLLSKKGKRYRITNIDLFYRRLNLDLPNT